MKTVSHIGIVVLLFMSAGASAQDGFCGVRNTTTQDGEQINYTVYYSVAGLYAVAGHASFLNRIDKLNGRAVYHVVGEGSSNARYDWIYKVRDTYESYIDTSDMQPLKFIRDVQEGKNKKYENISFNHHAGIAITDSGAVKVPSCIHDVLSAVYCARNIDFNSYKKNDTIPYKMFLENEVHNLYIRYLGKETIKTRYGKFRAIKYRPLLMEGTIFTGGEKMTVWVSDDANALPVRIESSILIGTIKVDMTSCKGLKYGMTALVKK
jgi:hypothetical protein